MKKRVELSQAVPVIMLILLMIGGAAASDSFFTVTEFFQYSAVCSGICVYRHRNDICTVDRRH